MKTSIIFIIIGVIILATVATAYLYLSSQQQTQEQQPNQQSTEQKPQPTPKPRPKHKPKPKPGENQQPPSQQSSEQQEQPSFDEFIATLIGRDLKLSGTMDWHSQSSEGEQSIKANFVVAYKGEKSKEYLKILESSMGLTGEALTIFFANDTSSTVIFCFKNSQTQDKWACFKKTGVSSLSEFEKSGGDPRSSWEEFKDMFSYEGVKNIHGINMHCFYASYTEDGTSIEERVCFEVGSKMFRYYWRKSDDGKTILEVELFIKNVSFKVSEEEFEPPVQPQPLPPGAPYP